MSTSAVLYADYTITEFITLIPKPKDGNTQ